MIDIKILIVASTLVFLVALWFIVGVRHLKGLKKAIDEQWELIDESLRKRHDLIPNLVETLAVYSPDKSSTFEQIIEVRRKAAMENSKGMVKIECEYELSQAINGLVALADDNKDLAKDTNFLELRKEIDTLEKVIEDRAKSYNEMVRYYNHHKNSPLFSFIALIFGMKDVQIFEVEI